MELTQKPATSYTFLQYILVDTSLNLLIFYSDISTISFFDH